jgi:ketosteroid isomerase-like protein
MKPISTILIVLSLFFIDKSIAQTTDKAAILKLMSQQETAWNAGNIPLFMEGYWKSDSLVFVGSKGPTYGWQSTLDGYNRRYPDRATMGTLKFTILKLQILDKTIGFVIGKWQLIRPEKGDVGGHFTLIFKKINGKWCIISDHTS